MRLGFLIMACALAGIAVSPASDLAAWQVAVLAVATLLSSASAGAFNQLWEADIDRVMRRTSTRAFVTGRFAVTPIWYVAILLVLVLSVVAAALATNATAAFYIFLGAFTYGVVYTVWLKRRTWLNIVIGGLAGSFAVMAGAAAVGAELAPAPLILAIVLFLWTPPHFWALAYACRRDYKAAGVPMLPVVFEERVSTITILVHTILLVLLSVVPFWLGMGWIYLLSAVVGGVIFLRPCIVLVYKPSVPQAWRVFAASIIQLGLLLAGAILDSLLLS
jgi:protoheme IX farnesyltransferase